MIYLSLYFEFFKIGLFAIGGGMATIPFLRHLSEKTGWFTIEFISDMLAISESTPGPIGINMATYAGYNIAGWVGGIIATLGMITPSIIIVLLVSHYLDRYRSSHIFESFFMGLRPVVTALIAVAGFDIIKIVMIKDTKGGDFIEILNSLNYDKLFFFLLILFLIKRFNKHPIVYIAFSGVVGIVLGLV